MITILLADDHEVVRTGLSLQLNKQQGMKVVGEASDGREAVRMARELAPSIVVLDITMPNLNGIEASRQILHELPKTRIVILSGWDDSKSVCSALRAGATGYALKQNGLPELLAAIRAASEGKSYLSPDIAGIVIDSLKLQDKQPDADATDVSPLTAREREVLQLLAEGKTVKVAASKLGVSSTTVHTHRASIMSKLGMDSIAELTKYAIREGITSL